jgi:hypothetical protein
MRFGIMAMNDVDFDAIYEENRRVLARTHNGGDFMYASLHKVVLFGLEHDPAALGLVNEAGRNANYGSITVRKGTGKGKLEVIGFRDHHVERRLFVDGIRLFTNMEVVFV